jgi:hypothetical protein
MMAVMGNAIARRSREKALDYNIYNWLGSLAQGRLGFG